MPRHQRHRRGGRNKGGGVVGAISLGIFKFKLWLCDPFVDCRKAGGARRAEYEEECGMTYVEYMFRAKNRETMWTPRMDLPPPRLNEDFLCSSKSSPTPATTPGSTSAPTSYYSDDTDRDSNDTDSDEKEEEVSLEPVVRASLGGDSSSLSLFASMSAPRPSSRPPSTTSFTEDDILGGKLWWF
eukprot:jgi/Undpi1/8605/HiC_scaffold_25.g11070.m1